MQGCEEMKRLWYTFEPAILAAGAIFGGVFLGWLISNMYINTFFAIVLGGLTTICFLLARGQWRDYKEEQQ